MVGFSLINTSLRIKRWFMSDFLNPNSLQLKIWVLIIIVVIRKLASSKAELQSRKLYQNDQKVSSK